MRFPHPVSSPRSWGCFFDLQTELQAQGVFPTLVGVFLSATSRTKCMASLPHARGGVSRRCLDHRRISSVFPTLVGVFPNGWAWPWPRWRLPHARGGVSEDGLLEILDIASSPRSWGCFYTALSADAVAAVFPTLVGVFPLQRGYAEGAFCLPHARGGVSVTPSSTLPGHLSSPRSWGCFTGDAQPQQGLPVFPTLVGVFPRQSPAWGTIRSKWELLHVLCPYSKEINANGTLLKRRKKASYRANFLLIVPMLYRFKKYF